jgi:hypothetical protein
MDIDCEQIFAGNTSEIERTGHLMKITDLKTEHSRKEMESCKNYEHLIEDYSGVDFELQFRLGYVIMAYRNEAQLFQVSFL